MSVSGPHYSRTLTIFGRRTIPGIDFALTEVVHCKSVHEIGVADAAPVCEQFLVRDVLCASPAKVVVCLGVHADAAVKRHLASQ